jgi:hypothetical protein
MRRIVYLGALAILIGHGQVLGQVLQTSLSLHEYGWKPAVRVPVKETEFVDARRIGFDTAGQIYVGFSITGQPKLIKRGDTNNVFRVLKFGSDAKTLLQTKDFETQSERRVGINLSSGDDLIVTADEKIHLIDRQGSPKTLFEIQKPERHYGWSIRESASGKTLLVQVPGVRSDSRLFLRTDTLTLVARCDGQDYVQTFSDSMEMKLVAHPSSGLVYRSICDGSDHFLPLSRSSTPVLIDNSSLLEIERADDQSILRLQKLDGATLWTQTLPIHFFAVQYPVRTTRDGGRFAIEITEERGGNRTLDISSHTVSMAVVVFDARSGNQLYSVKVRKTGLDEFALSPLGDRLAILYGGTLEIWKLKP